MTALVLVLVLAGTTIAVGAGGARLVRRSAPVLARVPRLAAAVLLATASLWVLTLLALGPLLAWVSDGPALLTGPAGEVCQRCLASSNPFGAPELSSGVPAAGLLGASALAGLFLLGSAAVEVRRSRRTTVRAAAAITGTATTVLGHHVLAVDDERPFVFALPARHGGIVLSEGCRRLLAREELAAVLAHEAAHLRQRHHVVTLLTVALVRRLSWVPLLAAVRSALPLYLEIAADRAARREVGTPALAAALLRLGEREALPVDTSGAQALHAAGPDRIRHLVCPPEAGGRAPAAVVAVLLAALAVVNTAVHLPLLLAAWSGCL